VLFKSALYGERSTLCPVCFNPREMYRGNHWSENCVHITRVRDDEKVTILPMLSELRSLRRLAIRTALSLFWNILEGS
jgi:hypothetical protein